MKIQRQDFLSTLEGVTPGVSDEGLVEQSDCIIFKNGKVYSYNEETVCVANSPFDKTVVGAVSAKHLLELMRKLPDDEIDVRFSESSMTIRTKGSRRGELRCEQDILIDVDNLEVPDKWTSLPEDFAEAVDLVQSCAGRDGSITHTCLHIHPQWVEACDDVQLCRYRLETGIKERVLIYKESIRHVVRLGMIEFNESESWLHFRNADKLQLSCRRYLEDYPNLSKFLKVSGDPVSLPKGLKETLERTSIFIDDPKEDAKRVHVQLLPDKIRLTGAGAHGKWVETKKTNYAGKNISFLASPKVLLEMSAKHNTCEASGDHLKVDGGKWKYVVCLERVPEHTSNGDGSAETTNDEE